MDSLIEAFCYDFPVGAATQQISSLRALAVKNIFVSIPYSDDDESIVRGRVLSATRYCARLLQEKSNPICPAVFGHLLLMENPRINLSHDEWLEYALAFLTDAIDEFHVLKLDGYASSIGVKKEVQMAEAMDIQVTHIDI